MPRRPTIPVLRAAYDAQQRNLAEWLPSLRTEVWEAPSALAGWTIRELAFHTTDVPAALTRAVASGPVATRGLSIAEYTSAWSGVSSEIRDRSRDGAAGLTVAHVVNRHNEERAAMNAALDALQDDPVINARRGPIKVSDFLTTRINELVVHSRDLSASLPDGQAVAIDHDALGVAVRMLLGILTERLPGKSVEVRIPPYAAAQCIEGPRHTRGNPPNVVEADGLTWVEIATGRLAWGEAVGSGRVQANGERSDLSAYLPVLS
ncbi:MAG: hypothetical protein QOG53_1744 [Frankiales bacterium]|jgi:uncharacterized protein (TIGR03083 family)|nr:hypothetical protein [Frankiales bacterium]